MPARSAHLYQITARRLITSAGLMTRYALLTRIFGGGPDFRECALRFLDADETKGRISVGCHCRRQLGPIGTVFLFQGSTDVGAYRGEAYAEHRSNFTVSTSLGHERRHFTLAIG